MHFDTSYLRMEPLNVPFVYDEWKDLSFADKFWLPVAVIMVALETIILFLGAGDWPFDLIGLLLNLSMAILILREMPTLRVWIDDEIGGFLLDFRLKRK